MKVSVVGAGVAGLVVATVLAERGAEVTVFERSSQIGSGACSWLAGGMLAPWCERESAEAIVAERGAEALRWWPEHVSGVVQKRQRLSSIAAGWRHVTAFLICAACAAR